MPKKAHRSLSSLLSSIDEPAGNEVPVAQKVKPVATLNVPSKSEPKRKQKPAVAAKPIGKKKLPPKTTGTSESPVVFASPPAVKAPSPQLHTCYGPQLNQLIRKALTTGAGKSPMQQQLFGLNGTVGGCT